MNTILQAKALGKLDGTELVTPYRFSLYENSERLCLRPEQSFNGEYSEFSKLPGWCLESLMKNPQDELMIDHGSRWSVSGLLEAIEEAKKYIL